MLTEYNPDIAPNPTDWLALDEGERQTLVTIAHAESGLDISQMILHASGHVIIENQIAMEVPHVVANFSRLLKEGLGRHDAIHACAALVMEMMYNVSQGDTTADPNDHYKKRLGEMTAEKWLNQDY